VNLDDLERELLRGARRELAPSNADRERHEAQLLARLGGGSGTGSGGGASGLGLAGAAPLGGPGGVGSLSRGAGLLASLKESRFTMLGVGLIVGAMVGGWFGFGMGRRAHDAELARASVEVAAAPTPSVEATAVAEPRAAPELVETPPEVSEAPASESSGPLAPVVDGASSTARTRASTKTAVAPRKNTPASGSSLAEEVAMLQRARRALAAENGALALGLVEELDERFPKGVLIEERSATRVLSLCKLERTDEARHTARAFLERYPGSVYAERVRNSCAAERTE
jgi:hypothetical protein